MPCLLVPIDGRLGSAVAPKLSTGNHPTATRGSRMTAKLRGGVKYLLAIMAIHHNLWIAVPGRQFDRSVDNLLGLTEGDVAVVEGTGAGDRIHSVSNRPDPETGWKKMVNRSRDRLGKKRRMAARCLIWLLAGIFLTSCATPHRDRLSPKLESTLLGALLWLDDHQVRDRPGHGSPSRDATDAGDGARQTATIHLPGGAVLEIPTVGKSRAVHNEVGSWVSEIHLFPSRIPLEGRALVSTPDANLFNTAFVLFPCFFFDDSGLEEPGRFVSRMRHLALENLRSYQRGDTYNFWRIMPGWEGEEIRTGPLNVPMPLLRTTAEAHRQPDFPAYRQALRSAGISGRDLPIPPPPSASLVAAAGADDRPQSFAAGGLGGEMPRPRPKPNRGGRLFQHPQ